MTGTLAENLHWQKVFPNSDMVITDYTGPFTLAIRYYILTAFDSAILNPPQKRLFKQSPIYMFIEQLSGILT